MFGTSSEKKLPNVDWQRFLEKRTYRKDITAGKFASVNDGVSNALRTVFNAPELSVNFPHAADSCRELLRELHQSIIDRAAIKESGSDEDSLQEARATFVNAVILYARLKGNFENYSRLILLGDHTEDPDVAQALLNLIDEGTQKQEDLFLYCCLNHAVASGNSQQVEAIIRYALDNSKLPILVDALKNKYGESNDVSLEMMDKLGKNDVFLFLKALLTAKIESVYAIHLILSKLNPKDRADILRRKDSDLNSLLHLAVENGCDEVVRYLLNLPEFDNRLGLEFNQNGDTAMHLAASAGDTQGLATLIHFGGYDVKQTNQKGASVERTLDHKGRAALKKALAKLPDLPIHRMPRSLCFKGGGVKGVAYPTALMQAIAEGLLDLNQVEVFTGTSAGAMTALMLAIGKTPERLQSILIEELNFQEMMSINKGFSGEYYLNLLKKGELGIMEGLSLGYQLLKESKAIVRHQGLCSFEKVEKYVAELINESLKGTPYEGKGGKLTFRQYRHLMEAYPDKFKEIRMVAWWVEKDRAVCFSPYNPEVQDVPIIKALLGSMSIPGFFKPTKFNCNGRVMTLVDGGLALNYPFQYAKRDVYRNREYPYEEVLGFYFEEEIGEADIAQVETAKKNVEANKKRSPNRFEDFLGLVFNSAKSGFYAQHGLHRDSPKTVARTVYIKIRGINATDLDLDEDGYKQLIEAGKSAVHDFKARTLQFPQTALSLEVVHALENVGAKVDVQHRGDHVIKSLDLNELKLSPLNVAQIYAAAEASDIPLLRILVNPNVRDGSGFTAYHIAKAYRVTFLEKLLKAAGANSHANANGILPSKTTLADLPAAYANWDGLPKSEKVRDVYQAHIDALETEQQRLQDELATARQANDALRQEKQVGFLTTIRDMLTLRSRFNGAKENQRGMTVITPTITTKNIGSHRTFAWAMIGMGATLFTISLTAILLLSFLVPTIAPMAFVYLGILLFAGCSALALGAIQCFRIGSFESKQAKAGGPFTPIVATPVSKDRVRRVHSDQGPGNALNEESHAASAPAFFQAAPLKRSDDGTVFLSHTHSHEEDNSHSESVTKELASNSPVYSLSMDG